MISFRFILVAAALLLIAGCAPASYEERTGEFLLPEGLKDCKIYRLQAGNGSIITVVRCPNSSTVTHRSGKSNQSSIVIDPD